MNLKGRNQSSSLLLLCALMAALLAISAASVEDQKTSSYPSPPTDPGSGTPSTPSGHPPSGGHHGHGGGSPPSSNCGTPPSGGHHTATPSTPSYHYSPLSIPTPTPTPTTRTTPTTPTPTRFFGTPPTPIDPGMPSVPGITIPSPPFTPSTPPFTCIYWKTSFISLCYYLTSRTAQASNFIQNFNFGLVLQIFCAFVQFRRTNVLLFLLIAMLAICEAGPKNVYLLAGQSNMSGRGGMQRNYKWDGVIPLECEPNPKIFRFTGNLTWEEAREPLHTGIDPGQPLGIGPGMPFANSLLKLHPFMESIGLVPCAIGGSRLSSWGKGQDNYKSLIGRARASTRDGGVIRALLWYQGEADSYDHDPAQSYGERFDKFVNDLRTDLDFSTLPIIQVALASGGIYKNIVRAAQLERRLPNVQCVDAMGLQLEWDDLHLTAQSQVVLGEKIALRFLTHY